MGRIIDMMQKRYLGRYLLEHPHNLDKMVFIAGPRQVGKTTLVQSLGPKLGFKNVLYLGESVNEVAAFINPKTFSNLRRLLIKI